MERGKEEKAPAESHVFEDRELEKHITPQTLKPKIKQNPLYSHINIIHTEENKSKPSWTIQDYDRHTAHGQLADYMKVLHLPTQAQTNAHITIWITLCYENVIWSEFGQLLVKCIPLHVTEYMQQNIICNVFDYKVSNLILWITFPTLVDFFIWSFKYSKKKKKKNLKTWIIFVEQGKKYIICSLLYSNAFLI